MNIALVFAGGTGIRMRTTGKPKQFIELYGKPIIIYTLEVFERHPQIDNIIVPCVAGWEKYLADLVEKFHLKKVKKIITGGVNTQESKLKALNAIRSTCKDNDIILLHDAVRPLVTEKMISDNIMCVKKYGSAVTAVPFTETGIISDNGEETQKTIIRNTLYIAKAPQSFYFKDVLRSHTLGQNMSYSITIDTVSLMTELGEKVHLVPCTTTNIKITTPEDYYIFKALVDLKESRDIFGM
ncbi:IspD/TarI family cytidylyltransferase [Pectinatus frisingensis]|uniref:IspD/TarI family cytidylyltransferase n=1 Tax=Pectinatus frisingensis TaxID=865 RepID=UPI0018C823F6